MPVGIGKVPPGAQSPSTTNDLLTPPDLLEALGALAPTEDGYELGADPFDLDPCASRRQPWPTARVMWTEPDDGMAQSWNGEVWLNSPYGRDLYAWLARLAAHGNGLALLYARTDTQGFHSHVWGKADAVYFFAGRLYFHLPVTGRQNYANCGGPMALAIYGEASLERVKRMHAAREEHHYGGHLVTVRRKGKRG